MRPALCRAFVPTPATAAAESLGFGVMGAKAALPQAQCTEAPA